MAVRVPVCGGRRGIGVAVAAVLALHGVGSAQSFHARGASQATVANALGGASAELERLESEVRRLELEAQGFAPRRAALRQRARREVRALHRLVQAEGMALSGGPGALLEHMALVAHARRALQGTLTEVGAVARREESARLDRARLAALVREARTRVEELQAEARQAEARSGLRLAVTNAGLDAVGARATGASEGPSVTVYGGAVEPAVAEAPSFAHAAGRLLFPVAGRTEARRVQREGADGPGLELRAPMGSPVRAVYAGRVAFSDRYGTYGQLVILDHGEHFYSVSANLATVNVHVGEEVTAGTVLGTVGDDGRGPMLYFELRRNHETIDPSPWLGL